MIGDGARGRGRRIGRRMRALVAIGLIGPLAVLVWSGMRGFSELERRLMVERELVARLVAERVGAALRAEFEALEEAASEVAAGDAPKTRMALRRVYLHRRVLFDEVFFVDGQGAVAVHEPAGRAPLDAGVILARARRALGGGFTEVEAEGAGGTRLYALVPVRGQGGDLAGVIGAGIDPGGARLATLLRDTPLEPGESIDVVDIRGTVVASTDPARLFRGADHSEFLAGLIRDRRFVSGSCHGCHADASGRVAEVFAFAPLPLVPWGITVRQPESAAFAFTQKLSRNLALWTVAAVALALLFAWGATLSVTRPLDALTRSAERISSGDLEQPVPVLSDDEIGRLGQALEAMRVALRDSLERIARANEELELRVRERTAELQGANRSLKERERDRRAALSKVLSAQEDERRRVARELHDETSQSLAALVMALQAAARAAPEGEPRRRLEESAALAVRTLAEVHRVIVDLRPSVLDDLGLRSAIVWYAERYLKPRGVNVRCEFSGMEERLLPEVETALFRCAQEALTNVARHARAENVLVQGSVREGVARIEIEDDGEGFDPASLGRPDEKGRGLGLLGMRERVELLGGTFHIDAAPGQGAHITVEVPLPEAGAPWRRSA